MNEKRLLYYYKRELGEKPKVDRVQLVGVGGLALLKDKKVNTNSFVLGKVEDICNSSSRHNLSLENFILVLNPSYILPNPEEVFGVRIPFTHHRQRLGIRRTYKSSLIRELYAGSSEDIAEKLKEIGDGWEIYAPYVRKMKVR